MFVFKLLLMKFETVVKLIILQSVHIFNGVCEHEWIWEVCLSFHVCSHIL